MRILVVQPRTAERANVANALLGSSHQLECANDAAAALQMLEQKPFDVLMVEHALTGMSGHELVRRFRAREGVRRTWVMVTNALASPGCVQAAFAAGADDFVPNRCSKDELLARLDGKARVQAWVAALSTREEESPRADALRSWTESAELMTTTFGDMLGIEVTLDHAPPDPSDRAEVAVLPLTLAATGHEVSVRAALTASGKSLVCEHLLGAADAEPEAARDMLREIANLSGGIWKRLAAGEGHAYSVGIPRDASWVDGERGVLAERQWTVCASGKTLLHLRLELRQRCNERVPIETITEGMVLAQDVFNLSGGVLLRGGTRLTRSLLTQLSRALGTKAVLEVAVPAA